MGSKLGIKELNYILLKETKIWKLSMQAIKRAIQYKKLAKQRNNKEKKERG